MKLAVIGSRGFNNYELLKQKLDKINSIKSINIIVSGGADGADSLAEKWAKENGKELLIFLPDWNKFGKAAGYKRNVQIIEASDAVIAFWDGESRGTQHSINITKAKEKPLAIIKYNEILP